MRNIVEKPIDVCIDHPAIALIAKLADAMDSGTHRASTAVGVAAILEFPFEDVAGHQVDRGLHDPVTNSRYGQVAQPGSGFGDADPEQRKRSVDPAEEAVFETVELPSRLAAKSSRDMPSAPRQPPFSRTRSNAWYRVLRAVSCSRIAAIGFPDPVPSFCNAWHG